MGWINDSRVGRIGGHAAAKPETRPALCATRQREAYWGA
jgi:hypothetical protein